jgi:6-pyruvoyltetrahydropterin/6-carboxytetrahydropterin synthase
MEIYKQFTFEAAHHLPNVPDGHQCARVHGHSYKCQVHVAGPLVPRLDWIVDYAEIAAAFEPIRARLDHRYLNDIEGLENPTTEVLVRWIWPRLQAQLPCLCAIVLQETSTSGCIYRGE